MMIKRFAALACAFILAGTSNAAVLLSESFNNVAGLGAAGWVTTNNSSAGGSTSWFQGNPAVFGSASGAANAYVAANFNSSPPGGAISTWLLTPTLNLINGVTLNFSYRLLGEGFVDTLQVYRSTSGSSSNVGSTTTSTGVFSLLNTYSSSADTGWVTQTLAVTGLSALTPGRFAFRYVASNTDIEADYVGLDSVSVTVPEPASLALIALALVGVAASRRRA